LRRQRYLSRMWFSFLQRETFSNEPVSQRHASQKSGALFGWHGIDVEACSPLETCGKRQARQNLDVPSKVLVNGVPVPAAVMAGSGRGRLEDQVVLGLVEAPTEFSQADF